MKKQLLQESEIRRMMKFANIGALSSGFVQRLSEQDEMASDDDELMEQEDEELAALDAGPEDPEMDVDVEEPEMDVDVEEPGVGGEMELSEEEAQVLIDLGSRLEGAMPEEEEGEDLGDLGSEEEMGFGAEEEDEEMGFGAEEELEENLVNEVARRVSRRIVALRG